MTFWSILWEKFLLKYKNRTAKVEIHKNISHRKQLFNFSMGNISLNPPQKGVPYKKKSHRNTLFKFSVGKISFAALN